MRWLLVIGLLFFSILQGRQFGGLPTRPNRVWANLHRRIGIEALGTLGIVLWLGCAQTDHPETGLGYIDRQANAWMLGTCWAEQ